MLVGCRFVLDIVVGAMKVVKRAVPCMVVPVIFVVVGILELSSMVVIAA